MASKRGADMATSRQARNVGRKLVINPPQPARVPSGKNKPAHERLIAALRAKPLTIGNKNL
jgi:hypothetical protein